MSDSSDGAWVTFVDHLEQRVLVVNGSAKMLTLDVDRSSDRVRLWVNQDGEVAAAEGRGECQITFAEVAAALGASTALFGPMTLWNADLLNGYVEVHAQLPPPLVAGHPAGLSEAAARAKRNAQRRKNRAR